MSLARSIVGSTFVTVKGADDYVQVIVVEHALDDDAVLFRIIVCSYHDNVGQTDWAYARNLLDVTRWERYSATT